jgi:PAS domain S-box-containing protein
LLGDRVWPGIAVGAFLSVWFGASPLPLAAAFVYAIGATLAALTGSFLLRRVVHFNPLLSRMRDALGLIAFGALGSSVVSASIGTSVLYTVRVHAWSGFGRAWLIYWLGDSMGVLLLTPLVLSLPNLRRSDVRARIPELVSLLLLLSASCLILFGDLPFIPVRLHILAFAVLPFVIWAAVRFGVIGATLSTLLIATIATVETALGSGPFAQNTPFINAVLLDIFFAVLSLSGLILAAVIEERKHAEREREELARNQAAMQSRLRLAAIVESSDDAIIGQDLDGIIIDWNKGAERLYGYSADEIIGKSISFLASPDRAHEFAAIMEQIEHGDSVNHFETIGQNKDGIRIEVSLTVSPIFDTDGRIVGASAIARDISEQKHQVAILRESEMRFRLMADSAPALIWMSGTDKLCSYFNKTWLDFTGRSLDQEMGNGWAEGVHRDDVQRCLDVYTQAFDRQVEFRMEYRLRRHDGEYRWIFDVGVPRFNADHSFVGYIGSCVDMTERRRAEKTVRESEERFRMAAQVGKMFAYDWDITTGLIVRSGESARILGIDETTPVSYEELMARVHPDDRERLEAALAELSPGKPQLEISYRRVLPDGTVVWVERKGQGYFDEHGKIRRIIGSVADITERKLAEEALRQKDKELSEAQRLAEVGSWRWDAQSDIVTWSEELYRIAGRDPTMPAPDFKDHAGLFTAESYKRLQRAVEEALQKGASYELDLEMVRPDGTTRWVRARGEALGDTTGRIVRLRGTAQDITERKLAEEALAGIGGRLIEAHEEERTWIARELHDDITQRLALLTIDLELAGQDPTDSVAEIRNRVREQSKRVQEISTDVQAISHRLHSSKLQYLGIVAAANSFCQELAAQRKVEIDFTHADIPPTVPEEISLCLFRVMQEALHNAVKHSGVRHFEVELRGAQDGLHIAVRDGGLGFDPRGMSNERGLGIVSMHERVNLVKGTFSIDSQHGRGATINAWVPLTTKSGSALAARTYPIDGE